MKKLWLASLSLALCFACAPAEEGGNNSGGSGGSRTGGSGGSSSGGSGGSSSGGSGGSASGGSGGSASGGSGGSASGGSGGSSSGGSGGSSSGGSGGSASGGSGGSGGGIAGSGGGGSGSPDAAPEASSGGGTPASSLHNAVVKMACANQTANATACPTPDAAARRFEHSFPVGGDPAKVYKVTMKICGVFEGRSLTGCAANSTPNVCVDGMTVNSPNYLPNYPTLTMEVPEPRHVYHLNRRFQNDQIVQHDYMFTFEMKGGSTVVIKSDGGANSDVYTGFKQPTYTCPNVPGITIPYRGQFFHFQVVSVE